MNYTILCPGPSLGSAKPEQFKGVIIGVNRAAIRWPCDVWSCADTPLYEQIQHEILGRPLWLVSQTQLDTINDHIRHNICLPWRGEIQTIQPMLGFMPHAVNWVMFSFTYALVYAAWKGATDIDIYGCDWKADAPDFDGVQGGKNRSKDRFRVEKGIYQAICERLPNVRITRHVPSSTATN